MLDLEMVKRNGLPFEYSQRSDGKWNLWVSMNRSWFDSDFDYEIFESDIDFDYKQWVVLDVLDELPQAHALRNIKNKARGKK